jgi:hypothetical protein
VRRTTTGGSSTITRWPSRTVVSLDKACRLVRWRALVAVCSTRERAGLSGAAAIIDWTSRRECHTSNADGCAIFAISARYSAEQPCTAVLPSPSESPAVLAATTKLAASRLTSHSHGPGWVSSKSFRSKTGLRSGVAKVPTL